MVEQPCRAAEEWRAIAGYEGFYEVSSLGRIRRMAGWPIGGGRYHSVPKTCSKPAVKRTGYAEVALCVAPLRRYHLVHRLVAAAFIGPCPDGYEVNHKDTNRANNVATNLEYLTKKGNAQHSILMGRRNGFVRDSLGRYAKASS